MLEFWNTILFSLSVTVPIFILLALGAWLRQRQSINDAFIEVGSRLVFTWALPALLFVSIAKTHIDATTNFQPIAYGLVAMSVLFVLTEIMAHFTVQPPEDRGVVVQSIFRSNMAHHRAGVLRECLWRKGVGGCSLILGILTILFNILDVITLSRSLHKTRGLGEFCEYRHQPADYGHCVGVASSWADVQPTSELLRMRRILWRT